MFCKKKRDRGPSKIPTLPTPHAQPEIQAWIFFISHQDQAYGPDYGTRSYNKVKEQPANRMLVEKLMAKVNGVHNVHMVLRSQSRGDYGAYCSYAKSEVKRICNQFGYDPERVAVVELHFNAASVPEARGYEIFVSNHKSAIFSYPIGVKWSDDFGIVPRGKYDYIDSEKNRKVILTGIKLRQSGSGLGWVKAVSSLGCYTFLWEPFFCDYRNDETSWFFDDIESGIEKYAQFWQHIISVQTIRIDG